MCLCPGICCCPDRLAAAPPGLRLAIECALSQYSPTASFPCCPLPCCRMGLPYAGSATAGCTLTCFLSYLVSFLRCRRMGLPYAGSATDWMFTYPQVPHRLVELQREGYLLVIMNNQARQGGQWGKHGLSRGVEGWGNLPFRVM